MGQNTELISREHPFDPMLRSVLFLTIVSLLTKDGLQNIQRTYTLPSFYFINLMMFCIYTLHLDKFLFYIFVRLYTLYFYYFILLRSVLFLTFYILHFL